VRLKHRHGGQSWKAEAPAERNTDPSIGADASANGGKIYRGVPWWKKNKNPKIGEGYQVGYKYDYRKPKYKKPKQRKSRNGEQPVVEGEEQSVANEQQDAVETNLDQPAEEEKKGLLKRLRSKKSKKEKEEQSTQQEEQPIEEEQQPKQPKKQVPTDKKDGF
jgi:hypothetical protein